MSRTEASSASRDFGPLGGLALLVLSLAIGLGLGALAFWDGRHGALLNPRLLGPNPAFVNDLPFLGSLSVIALAAIGAWFLSWVRAVGWDRPVFGLLVFSLFADVVPALYQISLVLVFLVLTERALRMGDLPLVLTPIVVPIGLILVSHATTFVVSISPAADSVDFLFRTSFLLMVLVLPAILRTPRHLELLFRFMLISACISTAVSLMQFGLSLVSGSVVSFADEAFDRLNVGGIVLPRCTGLMLHPNHASNTLGAVAVVALYLGLGPSLRIGRRRRWLYLGAFLFLCLGVFLSLSRSGWLALGTATLLVPLIRWPRFALPYGASVLALGAVGWISGLLPALIEFVRDMNASSADFRWHIDRIAIQAFLEHPLLGVGVEGMLRYFNPYHLQVHNTYLQALAEMGLFGVGAFLLLLFWMLFRVGRAFRVAQDPVRREWLIALLLASAVLLVQNMVVMFLWIKFLWFWIALIEAAVVVCLKPARDEDPDQLAFLPAARDGI